MKSENAFVVEDFKNYDTLNAMKIRKLKKNQKLAIAIITIIALVFVAGASAAIVATRKPVVAFYDVAEADAEHIRQQLGDAFAYRTISAARPLAWELEQGAAPAMLVVPTGQALSAARAKAAPKASVSAEILRETTSSIRGLSQGGAAVQGVPFLSSHLEIAVNTQELRKTSVKSINLWSDFEAFAKEASARNGTQLLFAGKDSAAFLDILGAVAESLDGRQAYDNAAQLIAIAIDKAGNTDADFSAHQLAQALASSPDTPLYDALRMLNRWYKEGIIFSDVFSLDQTAVAALMEEQLSSAVIMTLNDHRAIAHSVIDKYASIYFPSNIPPVSRVFTAPVYFAVPLKNNKAVLAAARALLSTEQQEALSRATGLAPVLARCRIPDKQANDARHWVAGTNSPLAGLSRDCELTQGQRDALAAELGSLLRFGAF